MLAEPGLVIAVLGRLPDNERPSVNPVLNSGARYFEPLGGLRNTENVLGAASAHAEWPMVVSTPKRAIP